MSTSYSSASCAGREAMRKVDPLKDPYRRLYSWERRSMSDPSKSKAILSFAKDLKDAVRKSLMDAANDPKSKLPELDDYEAGHVAEEIEQAFISGIVDALDGELQL